MRRRGFLAGAAAAAVLYRPEARAESGPPVIDGLGEVRIDYPMSLIDEIIDSGTSACVVTVGNPALQGPEASGDTRAEIAAYESHIAAHPDRLMPGLSIADVTAAARQRRGLKYGPPTPSRVHSDSRSTPSSASHASRKR